MTARSSSEARNSLSPAGERYGVATPFARRNSRWLVSTFPSGPRTVMSIDSDMPSSDTISVTSVSLMSGTVRDSRDSTVRASIWRHE